MKQTPWLCTVIDGKPVVFAQAKYNQHLKTLEGKRCIQTIEEYKNPKADALRKFYFKKVLRPIAEYTGEDEDRVHNLMKQKFNAQEVMGEMVAMPMFRRNSGFTDEDKKVFIRRVRSWALDFLGLKTEPWGGIE